MKREKTKMLNKHNNIIQRLKKPNKYKKNEYGPYGK